METNLLVIFIVLALVAEVLGTIGGFGSSLFFVPIAAYFLDFHSVLGITAVFHVFSNLSKIILFRKGVKWSLVLYLGIPAVVFVIAGAVLSKYISSAILELMLATLLIFISFTFLFFSKISVKPTPFNSILSGVVSGFTAGIVGTGGAIRGLALSAFNLEKGIFIATSAFIDLGIDLSRSIVYIGNGFLQKNELYLLPILIVVSFAGTYIGKKILVYISDVQFKKIVLLLVMLVGIYTLYHQLSIMK